VQLARHFGAAVTGVCSTRNLDLVRSLGAHRVVDYTAEDFTRSGERYDLLFDAMGKAQESRCRVCLTANGAYLSANGSAEVLPDDRTTLKEHIEAGEARAVIDRRYPLEQIAEAHRYVDPGHKRGNVVVVIRPGAGT
jgi:NADPH:quinone reductase-like Zn-dependent oxidoreductase